MIQESHEYMLLCISTTCNVVKVHYCSMFKMLCEFIYFYRTDHNDINMLNMLYMGTAYTCLRLFSHCFLCKD